MKKSVLLLCAVLCAVPALFCSCSQVNMCLADELTASSWYTENPGGTSVALTFSDGGRACLAIKGDSDNTCKISGACLVNESSFVISDEAMAKNIAVDYEIYGNKIELTYMGSVLTLYKQE